MDSRFGSILALAILVSVEIGEVECTHNQVLQFLELAVALHHIAPSYRGEGTGFARGILEWKWWSPRTCRFGM